MWKWFDMSWYPCPLLASDCGPYNGPSWSVGVALVWEPIDAIRKCIELSSGVNHWSLFADHELGHAAVPEWYRTNGEHLSTRNSLEASYSAGHISFITILKCLLHSLYVCSFLSLNPLVIWLCSFLTRPVILHSLSLTVIRILTMIYFLHSWISLFILVCHPSLPLRDSTGFLTALSFVKKIRRMAAFVFL